MEMQREGRGGVRGEEEGMKEANPFDLYLINNEETSVTGHYWNH